MKKLLLIALTCFLCGTTFSQILTPVNPKTYGNKNNRSKDLLATIIPSKNDTLTNTNDTGPQIFYYEADSTIWAWSIQRGFFQVGGTGTGTGTGIVDDSIFVGGLIDTITFPSHPSKKGIIVPVEILDSLLHKFIDTGSSVRDGYVLSYDSTNQKWIMSVPGSGTDTTSLSNRINLKQNQLNGTGFVKASGTTISYDNTTYLSSIPNLQSVTNIGATTTNPIQVFNNTGGNHSITMGFDQYSGQSQIKDWRGYIVSIGTRYADSSYIADFPKIHIPTNTRVTIPFSVNNNYADSLGNITISTGSGTVTSVTGTAPIISSGGVTPVISADTSKSIGRLATFSDNALKQNQLSGTGYAKWSGTTPSYLTPTQVTADLNLFTTSLQGLVPSSGGSARKVLHADGTWKDTTAIDAWLLAGNAGTTSANFIGTTDAQPIRFKAGVGIYAAAGYISPWVSGSYTTILGGGTNPTQSSTGNTIIGAGAGGSSGAGTDNTFIGYQAGSNSSGSVGNVGVGHQAVGNLTSGDYNVGLGEGTGLINTTGSYNIYLGYKAGEFWSGPYTGTSNELYISDSTNKLKMKLDSAVGTAPSVIGKDANGWWHVYQTPSGGGGGGTVTSVAALTLGTTGTDLSSSVANSTTTPVITLNVPTASASNRGALSSTDWTTFNNKLSTVDTTNISNFSTKVRSLFSATAPVTYSNGLIGISQSTTSTNGYLSSTDWNTFNGKASTASVALKVNISDTASMLDPYLRKTDTTGMLSNFYIKDQVDSIAFLKSDVGHTHDAADVVSGVFDAARIPLSIFTLEYPLVSNTAGDSIRISQSYKDSIAYLASPIFTGTPKISSDTVATKAYARSVGGSGTVTGVTGTTNRITSTGGATPVIDISATFEGLLGKVANRIDQNNASTTSSQFLSAISDESGTGVVLTANGSAASLTSFPTFNQNTTGSAAILTTSRNINGVAFNGSSNITVTADASTLTGTTLNSPVVVSSLTSVGTIATGVWNGTAVDATHGGTNQTTWTQGDLIYSNGSNTLAKLGAGTNGQVLKTGGSGANPSWIDLPTNNIAAYQALGSVVKAEAVGSIFIIGNTAYALVDGRACFVAIYLPKAETITGVKFWMKTQGVYTADNNNYVALYTYSGGTITRVAISADDGNLWKAASNSMITVPFTGTYAAAPGLYYIGLLVNASGTTTAPALKGSNDIAQSESIMDFTNSAKMRCYVSSQTTLPTSQALSGTTGDNAPWWAALY